VLSQLTLRAVINPSRASFCLIPFLNNTLKSQFSLKLHNSKISSTSNQTTLQQQEQVSFHLNYVGMIDFFT